MDRRGFVTRLGLLSLGSALPIPPLHSIDESCSDYDQFGVRYCSVGIDSEVLDVTASDRQHASEWCWAASIEALFTYYDHPVPQERIVQETWGEIVNMPGNPWQILRALNRKWTDENGSDFTSHATTVGTNIITTAQDLRANHPLVIGALGHATILTALNYWQTYSGAWGINSAVVRDPWPGNPSPRILSPAEWFNVNFAARIRVANA